MSSSRRSRGRRRSPSRFAGLVGQTLPRFRVVVSDQTEEAPSFEAREVAAVVRTLEATGRRVELRRHLPRRGMAEHRDSLLERARAPYALFLDDDVLLEHDLLERLLGAIRRAGSGFVGSALVGPVISRVMFGRTSSGSSSGPTTRFVRKR